MAQNQRRMIYLKIWSSEQFNKLSDKAKLLFIGSLTLADDDGRLIANPAYLRGQIFPYDEEMTVPMALQLRNEIEKIGLFHVYKIDNSEYIEHPKWLEYQIIRRDLYKPSALPTRNGAVTESIQKRDTSKDKLSKDNIHKADKSAEIAETSSANLIPEVIKAFEEVNPASKKFYGNTTQRKACDNLIALYGLDQVLKVIAFLPKSNSMPYMPRITTPLQLEDKWSALESAIKQKKLEKISKSTPNYIL